MSEVCLRDLCPLCLPNHHLHNAEVDSEDEYGRPKKASKKQKQRASSLEHARADQHTLDEILEHMLSASFDVSASIDHSGVGPSSSQMDVDGFGFGFPDDPLLGGDDLNLDGDIGDELARELGEGWGGPPSQPGPISAGGMEYVFLFTVFDPTVARASFDGYGFHVVFPWRIWTSTKAATLPSRGSTCRMISRRPRRLTERPMAPREGKESVQTFVLADGIGSSLHVSGARRGGQR